MKRTKKTSFLIKEPREPRRVAALQKLADKQGAADGVRQPTPIEIADLAVAMAREEHDHHDIGEGLAELFHWPDNAPPCRDPRRLFLPIVEEYKERAAEALRQHYRYYHALELRRARWLRAHPCPREWAWTRLPLKHAVPPPKGRPYRPPGLDSIPGGLSPPMPATGLDSAKRPGWRETEGLLWYAWLFDNGRVVLRQLWLTGVDLCHKLYYMIPPNPPPPAVFRDHDSALRRTTCYGCSV